MPEVYECATRSAPEHAGEAAERRVEARREVAADAGLGMERLDAEDALGAVVLQVGAADEAVAPQQRQHVVAVHALVLALVDLDHVPEAEHALEVGAVPDEVVEGREEHRGRQRATRLDVGRDEHGRLAVRDLEPAQLAGLDERVGVRADARGAARQPPHLGDRALGERAARLARRAASPSARTRRASASRRSGARGGTTRSGRSYRRWKFSRPAITSRPAECSASSTTFAGFQFHMPPGPEPSKCAGRERPALGDLRAAPAPSARAPARRRCRATDATPRASPCASGACGSPRSGARHASCAQYSKILPSRISRATAGSG